MKLNIDPCRNSPPHPRFVLSLVPREIRRNALSEIFASLKADTMSARLRVVRRLLELLCTYHELPPKQSLTEDQWYGDIADAAGALVNLYAMNPTKFGWELIENGSHELDEESDPYAIFLGIAVKAAQAAERARAAAGGKQRRKKTSSFGDLLEELGRIYLKDTERPPRVSRHHATGAPQGPYFRFVRAVCNLGGIDKTDEAIGSAISRGT
ncbi:hypothetical protein [Sinorhizobium fredii]|uniref:hypothetical protein n=1 Tax=Rhizobium fredii TaxID=380 RepID=UPI00055B3641|nr:hypothetical protein [Sinorhizobium fredii]